MPNHRWRKPMRSPGFDYRDPGPYFVTVCTSYHAHRFGSITEGALYLNDAGNMVEAAWRTLLSRFPGLLQDAFVVMPNHFHGLLTLNIPEPSDLAGQVTLTGVMQWFKTETTNRYIRGVRRLDWERFDGHLWQPGFHDRIVRSDAHMQRARDYIAANPGTWEKDEYYIPHS
jgi:putative transposase